MIQFHKSAFELAGKLWGGAGAAVVTVALVWAGLLEPLENWSVAQLFELRGARAPQAPIVIVTVDESSIAELNVQWPFPRAMHGQLLDRIRVGRPLVIGVDLIFDTPSSRGAGDDEALGAALARAGTVVLGAAAAEDVQVLEEARVGYRRQDTNAPLPVIRAGAAAVAPVNLFLDPDGHVRRAPIHFRAAEQTLLGFGATIYQLARRAGLAAPALPDARSFLINFRGGPRTFPWVPYYRVFRGEVEPEVFRGRIVLIGATSELFHDVFPTPFARSGTMPGVEIHANVIETLLRGNRVREVPEWVSTALAVAAALAGSALVVRLRALRALLGAVGLWVMLTLGAFAVFVLADIWMRGMAGTLALVLGYGSTVVEHFVREQREKRRLSRFFSPDVLRAVVRERDELALGSSRRLVTVLFSDLRGFTSISERLEPEQVAELLREYLTEMTEVVFKNGGTVDKYIGDCVMALYNVPFEDPEHAARAVRTGLELQERTLAAAARWEEKFGVSMRNGVGINTGEAVVGTLGSRQRLEYTAIGDTVNLAARLESLTKDYHASIIISEFTHEYVKDSFPTRALGAVTVKGKSIPVKIYAVLPPEIRKYPRAALEAGAVLMDAVTGQVCEARARDISEGGLALSGVPAEWTVGSKVEIRIEGGELPRPLTAGGTIAWRRGADAGVTFTQVESDSVVEYVARRGGGR